MANVTPIGSKQGSMQDMRAESDKCGPKGDPVAVADKPFVGIVGLRKWHPASELYTVVQQYRTMIIQSFMIFTVTHAGPLCYTLGLLLLYRHLAVHENAQNRRYRHGAFLFIPMVLQYRRKNAGHCKSSPV
jgi:hypothetical protein